MVCAFYNFKLEGSLSCGRRESETLLAVLMVIVLCGGIGTVPRRFVKYNKYIKMQGRQGKREREDEGEGGREITLTLICLRERLQHSLLMGKPVISAGEAPFSSSYPLRSVNHSFKAPLTLTV